MEPVAHVIDSCHGMNGGMKGGIDHSQISLKLHVVHKRSTFEIDKIMISLG